MKWSRERRCAHADPSQRLDALREIRLMHEQIQIPREAVVHAAMEAGGHGQPLEKKIIDAGVAESRVDGGEGVQKLCIPPLLTDPLFVEPSQRASGPQAAERERFRDRVCIDSQSLVDEEPCDLVESPTSSQQQGCKSAGVTTVQTLEHGDRQVTAREMSSIGGGGISHELAHVLLGSLVAHDGAVRLAPWQNHSMER